MSYYNNNQGGYGQQRQQQQQQQQQPMRTSQEQMQQQHQMRSRYVFSLAPTHVSAQNPAGRPGLHHHALLPQDAHVRTNTLPSLRRHSGCSEDPDLIST